MWWRCFTTWSTICFCTFTVQCWLILDTESHIIGQVVKLPLKHIVPLCQHCFFYCELQYCSLSKHSFKGTWCSGITSASHAEGPGFKSQCVHLCHWSLMSMYKVKVFPIYKCDEDVFQPGLQIFAPPHCNADWFWAQRATAWHTLWSCPWLTLCTLPALFF